MSTVSPTRPTVQDVARLLRARTKDDAGRELGTFNNDTRPTSVEVADIIQMTESYVLARTGVPVPDASVEAVRFLVTLKAAMDVELSYWPEQVTGQRSAYEFYERQFNDGMTALEEALEEGGGAVTEAADTYTVLPVGSWTRQPVHDFPPEEAYP